MSSRAETRRSLLDSLYARYNRPEFIAPDPLQFLAAYPDPLDREIVGLIASSLAYGRVVQILRSVRLVLDRMGSPSGFIRRATPSVLDARFAGFRHRFTDDRDLCALLTGIRAVVREHGSLEAAFAAGLSPGDATVVPALSRFVEALNGPAGRAGRFLVPSPDGGSACKRLNLFLRWMVRSDDVDPGGWSCVRASMLVVPLDTHMFRTCRAMGLTDRKSADLKAAIEITRGFARSAPGDPVKYDFALTRLGIRRELERESFLERWTAARA
jgi:uncharacterized protein (TIGR02757 family)